MTTLSIRLSEEEKRYIKTRAAYEGKTITQFILESTGIKNKGTIHEAIRDLEKGKIMKYNNSDSLIFDMKTW